LESYKVTKPHREKDNPTDKYNERRYKGLTNFAEKNWRLAGWVDASQVGSRQDGTAAGSSLNFNARIWFFVVS
jgi:hypothetical protein